MIGSGQSVGEVVWKQASAQIVLSAVSGAVIAQVVGSAEGGIDVASLASDLISIGGPIAIGAAVGGLVIPPQDKQSMDRFLKRGCIAAVVASGVSMYAGLLPMTLDMQTINFGLVVVGSVYVGDTLAGQLS